ncbi:MAG TPA: hypothetical protein DIU15_21150 [Deltaproteobacteria bacterium]|nr:hypothetical protein [Deltaproteobacteria bacterium]HCP48559.1 hypothetical protein [Deltaproteobacteria bacterium]
MHPSIPRLAHHKRTGWLVLGLAVIVGGCPAPEASGLCGIGGQPGLLDGSAGNPYPSMHLMETDSNQPTGCTLAIPEGFVPVGDGDPMDRVRLNRRDGFSQANTLWLSPGVALDESSLPPLSNPELSLDPSSSVQLWDLESGEPIPVFAELDAWEPQNDVDRVLLIRPLRAMGFHKRVAAVLTDSLLQMDGTPFPAPEAFAAMRDGRRAQELDASVEGHYRDLLDRLESIGVERSRVVFAWDFLTGSEENVLAPFHRVVDTVRAEVPLDPSHDMEPSYSLIADADDGDLIPEGLWREVRGSVQVTHFPWAEDEEATDPDEHDRGMFRFDEDDLPTPRGLDEAYFVLTVPESVRASEAGSVPVLVFGHGLFSAPQNYIASHSDESGTVDLCNRLQAICVGGEWRGLTERDVADSVRVATNLGRFPLLTDKLIQGVANQLALGRLFETAFINEPFLAAESGESLVDPARTYYFGISLGGIAGTVLLANSEVIDNAVFHVPGGVWSMMLDRSSNWEPLEGFAVETLPDPVGRQLLYSVTQLMWDPVDPINHLAGLEGRNGLWQVSVGDEQVRNFASEIVARSLGLPLVAPEVHPVFGLETAQAPLGPAASAYFQFDPQKGLPPDINRPADISGAHDGIRRTDEVKAQIEAFFEAGVEGTVIHPCDGPCLLGD